MDWYDEEVQQLIQKRDELTYLPQTIFYGSSSIRLWNSLYADFAVDVPINLGFGGSTLEACVYYFDRIVTPVQGAQKIIVYAGDNDLGDGRSPDEVLIFFRQIKSLLEDRFPLSKTYYVSIKPSISRWNINDSIKQTNRLIEGEINAFDSNMMFVNVYDAMLDKNNYPNENYYEEDGLHLSKEGYKVWKDILLKEVFTNRTI